MRALNRSNLPYAWLIFSLLGSAVSAQTVTVNINATSDVRVVDERIFGVNAVIWDPEAASTQTLQLVRDAGIRIIRVPGGSLSNLYHWNLNKSQKKDVPGVAYETWQWPTGFDKFTQLILGANTEAFVSVNYGTGTAEEAAAWVAYANAETGMEGGVGDVPIGIDIKGIDWHTAHYWANLRAANPLATDDGSNFLRIGRTDPIGIRHWEIGNENYGSWERDDWDTDTDLVNHDPVMYATRSKSYIAKMKAVDGTIKVGVVGIKTGEYNNWTRTLLTTLKVVPAATPDFLIYHRYDQGPKSLMPPGKGESDEKLLQSSSTWPADAADLRKLLNDNLGTSVASGIELLVTENNSVYGEPGKQSTSIVNGLFLADSVGNLLQTEFNALTWWDLRNGTPMSNGAVIGNNESDLYGWRTYGDYGMLSTPPSPAIAGLPTTYYEKYPTYYAMKLLSYFARGGDTVVQATSNNPLLATYAVRRDRESSLRLLVLNKSPTATFTGNFTINGFTPPGTANVYSFGIANDNAAKPGATGCSDISGSTQAIAGGAVTASFAPYSMTVLTLGGAAIPVKAGAPAISTQPASSTVTSGQSASFSVAAAACQAFTYQWQRQAAGSGTWQDLASNSAYGDGTSASLAIASATTTQSGDQFRVVLTNASGSTTSNTATLTVNASAPPPPPSGGGTGGGGGGGGSTSVYLLLALLGLRLLPRTRVQAGSPQ
ncbi:MAG TPA: hypothetical protein VKB34_21335 [Povalibacter sp.]|nr:hypothetical protein [Povalibacter sp.]